MFSKIKKLLLFIPCVILIISLLIINKKEEKLILLIGDNSGVKTHLQEHLTDYLINDSLSLSTMKSKELSSFICDNVSIINEGRKSSINLLIKKSNIVVLSIGFNDLFSKLTLNKYEKKIIYDLDSIELMFSLLSQNLNTIIEKIFLINKNTKIIISGYNNPFRSLENKEFNAIFDKLNSLMNSKSLDYSLFFQENNFKNYAYYDDEFSCYLNDDGKRKIAENIYQKIIAITT